MDGYGMVRNMIATNRSNLSRVGQRRSHKFESFDTSLFEPEFPALKPFELQPLSIEHRAQIQAQQQAIDKTRRIKDLIAGFISLVLTSAFMIWFFRFIF